MKSLNNRIIKLMTVCREYFQSKHFTNDNNIQYFIFQIQFYFRLLVDIQNIGKSFVKQKNDLFYSKMNE